MDQALTTSLYHIASECLLISNDNMKLFPLRSDQQFNSLTIGESELPQSTAILRSKRDAAFHKCLNEGIPEGTFDISVYLNCMVQMEQRKGMRPVKTVSRKKPKRPEIAKKNKNKATVAPVAPVTPKADENTSNESSSEEGDDEEPVVGENVAQAKPFAQEDEQQTAMEEDKVGENLNVAYENFLQPRRFQRKKDFYDRAESLLI